MTIPLRPAIAKATLDAVKGHKFDIRYYNGDHTALASRPKIATRTIMCTAGESFSRNQIGLDSRTVLLIRPIVR